MSKKSKLGKAPLSIVKDNRPPAEQTRKPGIMRCEVQWVDSYHRDGQPVKTDEWEGEDVGVNVGLPSSISIPLTIERFRDEAGNIIGETTKFLPHTFIREITFKRVDKKA